MSPKLTEAVFRFGDVIVRFRGEWIMVENGKRTYKRRRLRGIWPCETHARRYMEEFFSPKPIEKKPRAEFKRGLSVFDGA